MLEIVNYIAMCLIILFTDFIQSKLIYGIIIAILVILVLILTSYTNQSTVSIGINVFVYLLIIIVLLIQKFSKKEVDEKISSDISNTLAIIMFSFITFIVYFMNDYNNSCYNDNEQLLCNVTFITTIVLINFGIYNLLKIFRENGIYPFESETKNDDSLLNYNIVIILSIWLMYIFLLFDGLTVDLIDYMYIFLIVISFILVSIFVISSISDINKCEKDIKVKNDSIELRYNILITIITTSIIILLKSYY